MRTTIDLPPELLKEAKRIALERDLTLRELVTRGLELAIGEASPSASSRRVDFPLLELPPDSPLKQLTPAGLAAIESEDEAGALDAVYRRR